MTTRFWIGKIWILAAWELPLDVAALFAVVRVLLLGPPVEAPAAIDVAPEDAGQTDVVAAS